MRATALSRPLAFGGVLGAFGVLACIGLAGASASLFAPNVGVAAPDWPGHFWIQGVIRWDAGWYGYIAKEGYHYTPGVQSPVAFFPVYPLLVRGLVWLGADVWLAGIFVSAAFGVLSLALFARWAQTFVSEDVARKATAVFALYPFSFFIFGPMYADSVFLSLALGAFLALERQRLGWAAFLGALASGARPIAPAIVVGLLARRWEQRRSQGESLKLSDGVLLFAGAGLLAYAVYLGQAFGDPLAFAHVQSAPGWDQSPGWRTWLKVTWFRALFPRAAPLVAIRLVGHAVVTLVMLALVVPIGRRLSWGYAAYVAVAMGLPALSSKDFMGMGRYALAGFPAFLALSLLLLRRPEYYRAWLMGGALIWAALVVGFGATGYIS
ncbi:MAG: hypothetical protein ACKVPX_16310 [Myxococcaceae bacterium]